MPKKPTLPFGTINFSAAGKVTRNVNSLSSDKKTQESQVAEKFLSLLDLICNRRVELVHREIAEDGHDALASENGEDVQIQITELWPDMYSEKLGEGVRLLNKEREQKILAELIQKKFDKNYIKP